MIKISTSVFALALSLVAAPAVAGGLYMPPADPVAPAAPVAIGAPVAISSDWTGFYAGVQLGYGEAEAERIWRNGEDGAVYGAQFGYIHDFGRMVLGGEIEYVSTEIGNEDVAVDSFARAKLRAGYDAGAFLPYVTAGYSSLRTAEEIEGFEQFDGYVYGVGAEFKVTESFVVGGELLRDNFKDLGDTTKDLEATSAALRVSFKF